MSAQDLIDEDEDRIRVFCRVKPAELDVNGSTRQPHAFSRCVRTAGSGPFILPSTIGSEVSFKEYPVLESNVVELARRNVTNPQRFFFDGVLNEGCSQKDVFDMVARPLLRSLVAGFNAAIIAYGQTGSGKTYSLLGPPNLQLNPSVYAEETGSGNEESADQQSPGASKGHYDNSRLIYEGLLPRVMGQIIDLDHRRSNFGDEGARGQVLPPEWRCSCFEIYCNSIYDLLAFDRQELVSLHQSQLAPPGFNLSAPSASFAGADVARSSRQMGLQIREDPVLGPFVEGLREVEISNSNEALELVQLSLAARSTGETYLNRHSSRSHLVFQLRRTQRRIETMAVASPTKTPRSRHRSTSSDGYGNILLDDVDEPDGLVNSRAHRLGRPDHQSHSGGSFHSSDSLYQATKVHSSNSIFYFVDLAGSERLKDSGSTGIRKAGSNLKTRLAPSCLPCAAEYPSG